MIPIANAETIIYMVDEADPLSLEELADRINFFFKWENGLISDIGKSDNTEKEQSEALEVG